MGESSTMWALVERAASDWAEHVVLADDYGRSFTGAELATTTEAVAAGLLGLGIEPDARVSWQLPSTLEGMPHSTLGMSVDAPIDGRAIETLSAPTAESTRTNAAVVLVSLGVILRPLSGEGA